MSDESPKQPSATGDVLRDLARRLRRAGADYPLRDTSLAPRDYEQAVKDGLSIALVLVDTEVEGLKNDELSPRARLETALYAFIAERDGTASVENQYEVEWHMKRLDCPSLMNNPRRDE